MRVAYLCADPGIPVTGTKGASIHVQQIVRAFRRRGDDVTVYCARLGDGSARDLDGVRFVSRPVPRSDAAGREVSVAAIACELGDLARADGCDLVYERYSLFSDAALRTGAPSIVEVNAPLIDEQRRYRALVDDRRALGITRRLLGGATVVTSVSEPVSRWAREHGAGRVDGSRAIVTPNGVDTAAYRPRRREASGALQAVFVGSLKKWHGVETAIDALRRLDGVHLTIVGDGPERATLEAHADGLADRITWTGALQHHEVAAVLGRMDVGLAPYPSHAGDYFSPLKVYEYLAAGIPTIASAVGQLPSIIEEGRAGLLTPPDDPAALAEALLRLRDDRDEARRLGEAARAQAVSRHDWSRVLDDILAALPSAALADRALHAGALHTGVVHAGVVR